MSKEIKEILDRLERIDHKEYKTAFEFADSAIFEEHCRCFDERKKLAKCVINLQKDLDYQRQSEIEYNEKHIKLMNKYNNSQITLAKEWKKRLEVEEKNKHLEEENRKIKLLKDKYQLEKEDYKLRIEKAIEYINTHYLNANENELLNILQGVK